MNHSFNPCLAELPELSDLLLKSGKMRLRITSESMAPALKPGDEILVDPVAFERLRPGDLILFRHGEQLVCHRLIESSDSTRACLTRGDAATGPGEWIQQEQILGKVTTVRKRGVLLAAKEALQRALFPVILHGLERFQELKAYRILMRPLIVSRVSYHLGIAKGSHWYEWREVSKDGSASTLPNSQRPHLLAARWGTHWAGWIHLAWRDPAWRAEDLYVRMRYRGLGIETELARWADRLADTR